MVLFLLSSILRPFQWIIVSICLTIFVNAATIDSFPEIAHLPLIRIGITNAPNNGHQSAGITVINRLRELGYRGRIEVIFSPATKSLLSFLYPPFSAQGPDVQSYEDQRITFISKSVFDSPENSSIATRVPLVIMGADDAGMSAEDYKSDTMLKLQPLNWAVPTIESNGKTTAVARKRERTSEPTVRS